MPDEANGTTPPDQSKAIANLFDGGENPSTDTPDTTAAGDTTTVEVPEQYEAGRLPKQFHREDGKHDYEGLTKSWFELRKGHSEQSARVKELERQVSTMDEPWEAYSGDFDWESVKQRAPNAYTGGGADNEAAMSLLRQLHGAGLPKAKAAKAISDYYADLDKMVGETPSEAEQRKAAVASLGTNGPTMAREVQTFLESRAAVNPFSEDEMRVLGSMTRSGPALSILWRLSRQGASTSPPGSAEGVTRTVDPEQEKLEAVKGFQVSDEDWHRNKDAIIARWARANGVDPRDLRP